MKGVAYLLLLLALALAAPAGAAAGLELRGDTRPRHYLWLAASQAPLPPITITIVLNASPYYEFATHKLYIPQAGTFNWTYAGEQLEFFHELGHAFDQALLRPADRNRFRAIVGSSCRWWQHPCDTLNVRCGCGQILDVPPGEMFAEEYAALSLGISHQQIEDRGLPTYGWNPPPGTEPQLRQLVEQAANR